MKLSLKSIELGIVCLLILVFSLVAANNPSITGHVTSEIHIQKLDFEVTESTLIGVESISNKPLKLTSLMVSGKVIGEGLAEIYLTSGKEKKLVYTNLQKKKKGLSAITGQAAGAVRVYEKAELRGNVVSPEGYQTIEETFGNACVETCFLEGNKQTFYDLEVWVQPGTKMLISELKYSVI